MRNEIPYVNIPETIGYPPDSRHTREVLERVAGKIMSDTRRSFTDPETGMEYENPEAFKGKVLKLSSGYTDWKYWNGVIHIAFMRLGRLFDRPDYLAYPLENHLFGMQHLAWFRSQYEQEIAGAPYHQYFRFDRLDDCGAMGASLLECYKMKENSLFLDRIRQTGEYILKKQDRLDDGTFVRRRFGKTTLWADDLYMSVPFLSRMYEWTGEEQYLDECVRQAKNFFRRLFDPQRGLYCHSWCQESDVPGVAYWGRANGWVALAMCDLIDRVPENHPERAGLIRQLFLQITGFSRYQTQSGLWRQLLDKADAWPETSSTAMFAYATAHAVNRGWIDDMYASIAVAAWKGLLQNISADGEFNGVTEGFNIKQDLTYYYTRPIEKGGAHGLGALLLAGAEIYELKEYRDCVWC